MLPDSMAGTRRNRGGKRSMTLAVLLCSTAASVWAQNAQPIVTALRNKQYTQALDLAQQVLKTTPRNAQVLTLEGLAFRGLRRDEDALAAFQQALRADPDYVAALEGAAQIEYAAARPEAVLLLDRLLKLRPADPTAHAMRGVMAWKQRDCTTAVAHFGRSEAALAAQPEALREYGVCLVKLQRLEPAEKVFQQLVAGNPAAASARRSLSA